MKRVAPGIYLNDRGDYYERPTINGKRTHRKLHSLTLKAAKVELQVRRSNQKLSPSGLAKDPYAPPTATVAELCAAYQKAKCPDRRHHPRQGDQLTMDIGRLKFLSKFFGDRPADTIKPKDCNLYFAWRKARVKRGSGDCITDLDLNTLSNVFEWAASLGKLESNPIAKRQTFYDKRSRRRSFQVMPSDADQLHEIAAYFFKRRRQSHVLGWQVLLQAMTGCRASEIVRLRWDAKDMTEAGFMETSTVKQGEIEQNWLWLNRSKRGVKPFVNIHPALSEAISALRRWHIWRYPKSKWWLPAPEGGGKLPLGSAALVKALKEASKAVCGKHRTSHGLRAYYSTVRKSQGMHDGQIADELGNKSGAKVVHDNYADVPPNWRGGASLGWMPKGEPAWAVLGIPENLVALDSHAKTVEQREGTAIPTRR